MGVCKDLTKERRVFFLEFFKNGRGIESTPLRTIQMGRISERSQSLRDLPRRKRKVKRVKSIRKSSPATISFLPLLAYNRTPSSLPREGQSRCHKFASYSRNLGNWKEICGGMEKKYRITDRRFPISALHPFSPKHLSTGDSIAHERFKHAASAVQRIKRSRSGNLTKEKGKSR